MIDRPTGEGSIGGCDEQDVERIAPNDVRYRQRERTDPHRCNDRDELRERGDDAGEQRADEGPRQSRLGCDHHSGAADQVADPAHQRGQNAESHP